MKNVLLEIIQDPEFQEGQTWVRRHFSPNEVIVREGEKDRKVFLIERGELRVSCRVELEDHRSIKPGLYDLGSGDLFGELALFEAHPHTASMRAISEGVLVEIDCYQLSAYLDQRPEIGYAFFKIMFHVLIDRLCLADRRVEHLLAWGLKVHGIGKHL